MSKILFITPPAYGHINPVLPVMAELARRGEKVLCCNNEEFRPVIEQTGARFHAYPASMLTSTAISEALAEGNLSKPHLLMMQAAEFLAPYVQELLAQEKCDLAVFDSLAIWGKIAASSLNVKAAATISHLVFDLASMNLTRREYLTMMGQFISQLPHLLRQRRRLVQRFGAAYPRKQPLFPMRDRLNIVFTARDLQPDTPLIDHTFHFAGPSIRPQVRGADFPVDFLTEEPVVYISLGTVHHTNTSFYQACFQAFASYPARFVLSAGRHIEISSLGEIPDNFIVRPSVPQIEILQHASVFITHGGINSVHEGLYYGVPLILIPHQFEQLLNARVVTARGAGLLIEDQVHHRPVTAQSLSQALQEMVSTPQYSENARKVQAILQETGGYRQAAGLLRAYLAE